MTAATSEALVGDLISADRIAASPDLKPKPTTPPDPVVVPPPSVTPPPEDAQQSQLAARPTALGLTGDEIEIMKRLSPFLGGSPRRARRFVNVYRVAKASLTPAEVRALEEGQYAALATQLAIATGAPNAFAGWIDACSGEGNESLSDRLAKLTMTGNERGNIEGALRVYTNLTGGVPGGGARLAAQGARAARFSFSAP
jgi:hypothetical protein